eukprot:6188297-Pleurochrysis_carterae.AAC.1
MQWRRERNTGGREEVRPEREGGREQGGRKHEREEKMQTSRELDASEGGGRLFLSGCTASDTLRYCLRMSIRSSVNSNGRSSTSNSFAALNTRSSAWSYQYCGSRRTAYVPSRAAASSTLRKTKASAADCRSRRSCSGWIESDVGRTRTVRLASCTLYRPVSSIHRSTTPERPLYSR